MQVLANPDRKGGGGLTTPEKPSMAKEARPVGACGALFSGAGAGGLSQFGRTECGIRFE